jgi:hypothetical protein
MTVVVQGKERLYHDWHLTCAFLPLAIEVFERLHQVADFLH